MLVKAKDLSRDVSRKLREKEGTAWSVAVEYLMKNEFLRAPLCPNFFNSLAICQCIWMSCELDRTVEKNKRPYESMSHSHPPGCAKKLAINSS